jgi:hypothetical protein
MVFTWGALASRQFNASVARMAFGADDIGFLHALANYHPVTRNSTGVVHFQNMPLQEATNQGTYFSLRNLITSRSRSQSSTL